MSASAFSRQLKYASALVDSYGRLTAEALLRDDIDCALLLAHSFDLAKKFFSSHVWYDWKCSSYEIFSKKFSEFCSSGFEG